MRGLLSLIWYDVDRYPPKRKTTPVRENLSERLPEPSRVRKDAKPFQRFPAACTKTTILSLDSIASARAGCLAPRSYVKRAKPSAFTLFERKLKGWRDSSKLPELVQLVLATASGVAGNGGKYARVAADRFGA